MDIIEQFIIYWAWILLTGLVLWFVFSRQYIDRAGVWPGDTGAGINMSHCTRQEQILSGHTLTIFLYPT